MIPQRALPVRLAPPPPQATAAAAGAAAPAAALPLCWPPPPPCRALPLRLCLTLVCMSGGFWQARFRVLLPNHLCCAVHMKTCLGAGGKGRHPGCCRTCCCAVRLLFDLVWPPEPPWGPCRNKAAAAPAVARGAQVPGRALSAWQVSELAPAGLPPKAMRDAMPPTCRGHHTNNLSLTPNALLDTWLCAGDAMGAAGVSDSESEAHTGRHVRAEHVRGWTTGLSLPAFPASHVYVCMPYCPVPCLDTVKVSQLSLRTTSCCSNSSSSSCNRHRAQGPTADQLPPLPAASRLASSCPWWCTCSASTNTPSRSPDSTPSMPCSVTPTRWSVTRPCSQGGWEGGWVGGCLCS